MRRSEALKIEVKRMRSWEVEKEGKWDSELKKTMDEERRKMDEAMRVDISYRPSS